MCVIWRLSNILNGTRTAHMFYFFSLTWWWAHTNTEFELPALPSLVALQKSLRLLSDWLMTCMYVCRYAEYNSTRTRAYTESTNLTHHKCQRWYNSQAVTLAPQLLCLWAYTCTHTIGMGMSAPSLSMLSLPTLWCSSSCTGVLMASILYLQQGSQLTRGWSIVKLKNTAHFSVTYGSAQSFSIAYAVENASLTGIVTWCSGAISVSFSSRM